MQHDYYKKNVEFYPRLRDDIVAMLKKVGHSKSVVNGGFKNMQRDVVAVQTGYDIIGTRGKNQ